MRDMALWSLMLVLISAPLALADAQYPCDPSATFFPSGYANKNFPSPFTLDNQLKAGYKGTGQPLKVALSSQGDAFLLYFAPQWFLNKIGPVDTSCGTQLAALMGTIPVSESRALLDTGLNAQVIQPIRYSVSWRIDNQASTVLGTFTGEGSVPPSVSFRIDRLPDGDHCLTATATILRGSAALRVNGATVSLPQADIVLQQSFCFIKIEDRITADVEFDSCRRNFTVQFDNIGPRTPDVAAPGIPLVDVGVQVYGIRSPRVEDPAYDDYVSSIAYLTDPLGPSSLTWGTTRLLDGNYTFQIATFIRSRNPSLVDVSGPTFNDDGTATYNQWNLYNRTWNVFVVNQRTMISEPQCYMSGDLWMIDWTSQGMGYMDCYIDGDLFNNVELGHGRSRCEPPLRFDLNDTADHELEVYFFDSCDKAVRKQVVFNYTGCYVNYTAEPPQPPPPPPPSPEPPSPPPTFNLFDPNSPGGQDGSNSGTGHIKSSSAQANHPALQPLLTAAAAVLLLLGMLWA